MTDLCPCCGCRDLPKLLEDTWGTEILELKEILLKLSPIYSTCSNRQFALFVLAKWLKTKKESGEATSDLIAYYRRFVAAMDD